MIEKAILLAAHLERRPEQEQDWGTPLAEIAGQPLIRRSVTALEQSGIHDIVIVTGQRERLERVLSGDPDLTSEITWVECREWSVDAVRALKLARDHIEGPTVVLGADLLFCPELLSPVIDGPLNGATVALLVDRRTGLAFAPELALKVRLAAEDGSGATAALDVGRALREYQALATGIAIIAPSALALLDERRGKSLTTILHELASEGVVRAELVELGEGGGYWHQITSAEAKRHGEWLVRAFGDDLRDPGAVRPQGQKKPDPQRTLSYIQGLLSEKRARQYVLMNPGPVLTSPRVKSALVHYDLCHRDEDYSTVLRRVRRKLRRVCRGGADHEILLLSGSGTAAMEATLSSFVPKNGRILVLSNGAFGERFAEIARLHHLDAVHLRYEWGQLIEPAEVRSRLVADPTIVAVAMNHHETSVGILNPVSEVGSICRALDRMFFVDTISSLGAEDVDVRRDSIDVLISSANKCLHGISGVSFVCVNRRIWLRVVQIEPRVYYLDLKRYRDGSIPFTPAVSNILALDAALDDLLARGLQGSRRRYQQVNLKIRNALRELGLAQLTNTGHESHSITTVAVPEYIEFGDLYQRLKNHGYIVYACKDHLADRYFQVANMGELSEEMVQGFLDTLKWVLQKAAARRRPRVAVQASG
jgi:2-aminoethylphosphonate-pyruvate transaminase